MKRQHQTLLIASTLALSWLAMQVVHELGHVFAAWATGGRVAEVKLHPLAISYTLLAENPHPLWVAWMGPIVGVSLPVLAWTIAHRATLRGGYVFQFFAGFCLVANGAYLAGGSLFETGDAADIMRYGTPRAILLLFGLVTIPVGFWIWNGLGRHFGLGDKTGHVDRAVCYVVTLILSAVVVLELAFD